jgi:hypothetical protein
LANALVHRYRFEGTSTVAMDWVGTANGTVMGGAVHNGGMVTMSGGGYVDLPNGLVSALTSVTIELWVIWNGGQAGQRILDFGDAVGGTVCMEGGSPAPEGTPGVCPRTSLFITPAAAAGVEVGGMRASIQTVEEIAGPFPTTTVVQVDVGSSAAVPIGSTEHLAVVVDYLDTQLRLYHGGELVDSGSFAGSLSDLGDINNWLGQAQTATHPAFEGSLLELRIYDVALSGDELATSFAEGSDPAFLK